MILYDYKFMSDFFNNSNNSWETGRWSYDDEANTYVMEINAAGFNKDDLEVKAVGKQMLNVSLEKDETKKEFIVHLPDVVIKKIKASLVDGLLLLTLHPKRNDIDIEYV